MKGIGKGHRRIRAIDIGCGDGIIAFEILKHHKAIHVTAIDIDNEAVAAAAENLERDVEAGRAVVMKKNAKAFFADSKNAEMFERVVINPPFFVHGSGPANKRTRDQEARHEKTLQLKVWAKGVRRLLGTGGELYCVFPTERMAELFSELRKNDLEPKEVWWFKNDLRKRRFFLRAMRGARPGLIVHMDFNF